MAEKLRLEFGVQCVVIRAETHKESTMTLRSHCRLTIGTSIGTVRGSNIAVYRVDQIDKMDKINTLSRLCRPRRQGSPRPLPKDARQTTNHIANIVPSSTSLSTSSHRRGECQLDPETHVQRHTVTPALSISPWRQHDSSQQRSPPQAWHMPPASPSSTQRPSPQAPTSPDLAAAKSSTPSTTPCVNGVSRSTTMACLSTSPRYPRA